MSSVPESISQYVSSFTPSSLKRSYEDSKATWSCYYRGPLVSTMRHLDFKASDENATVKAVSIYGHKSGRISTTITFNSQQLSPSKLANISKESFGEEVFPAVNGQVPLTLDKSVQAGLGFILSLNALSPESKSIFERFEANPFQSDQERSENSAVMFRAESPYSSHGQANR